MFETIIAGVLLPATLIGLVVGVPLWRALRGAGDERPRPEDPPPDPLPMSIRTAAVLSPFGPFWYTAYIRPRVRVAAEPHPEEGDPT